MAVTFGSGASPSQVTLNLDSLFGTSLAAYSKTLIDNIGATNAFFHQMIQSDYYESQDGGAYIQLPLMYALAPTDSYDGYDTLSTLPTDGITDSIWQWRQLATPIAYSLKEVKQNKQKIVDLVKSRIKQAEMGIQEFWSTSFFRGDGTLIAPYASAVNGSYSIDPLPLLVKFDPTTATTVGNIDQSTNSWWQNKTKTSAATTYDNLILELNNLYHTCTLGTGGPPDHTYSDQTTYELLVQALYSKYRMVKTDENYPFENTIFHKTKLLWDDKVPDVYSGTTGTATYGSVFMLNTEFFRIKYESDSNFEMLKDEKGTTFQKPVGGDSRVGHVAWMGNICTSNRRKHGVMGKVARTLT